MSRDTKNGKEPTSTNGKPENTLDKLENSHSPLREPDCANFYKLSNFDCEIVNGSAVDSPAGEDYIQRNTYAHLSSDESFPSSSAGPLVSGDVGGLSASCCLESMATCANQLHQGSDASTVENCCKRIRRLKVAAQQQIYAETAILSAINLTCDDSRDQQQCLSWQAKASTIRERTAHMFLNSHLVDVIFLVGNDDAKIERIPAHKFVLAISSAVFDAMFRYDSTHNVVNSSDSGVKEVRIVDVEPKAFISLLRFLYKDEADVEADTVLATLYAAKKYDVPALEYICVDYLRGKLSAENAFFLLAQSRFFDETAFAESCFEIIDRETAEALQSDGFLEIDHGTLCAVLQRDALQINELPLFQAVVKWSLEECKRRSLLPNLENQRTVLGKALRLVRYTVMTITEFAENVAISGLLTSEELVSIFLHFTMSTPPPILFPIAQRRRFVGKQLHINRFQRVESSWGYSGQPDRIKFVVDRGIWLLGFGLYGSMNDAYTYDVTIELANSRTYQILAHSDTSFHADGSTSIFPVLFDEPIEILPAIMYTAIAKLTGPESHYGSKGLRRIVRQISKTSPTFATPPPAASVSSSPDVTISASASSTAVNSKNMTTSPISSPICNKSNNNCITFQFSFATGNNNGTSVDDGQIPQLIFSEKY